MSQHATKRKRPHYYPDFPNQASFQTASIQQQAHFVLTAEELRPGFESLGDVNSDDNRANAKIHLLMFVSKALKHGIAYRGFHANSTYIGGQPRAVVMLNYLLKEVFATQQDKVQLTSDQLFHSSNIQGVLVSILIFDDSLSFLDVLSDMMRINEFGLPQRRSAQDFAEQLAERHIEPAIEPAPLAVVGRPDIPNCHLDFQGSSYKFSTSKDARQKRKKKRTVVTKYYTSIKRIHTLFVIMQTAMGGDYSYVPQADSAQHLSTLGPEHRYQLHNLFTFDKALRQIGLLNVDAIFKLKESWVNSFREDGVETFGPPAWKPGDLVHNFDNGQPIHPAGKLETSAVLPLDVFRPSGICNVVLPHVSLLREELYGKSNEQLDKDEATGRVVNIGYIMESIGMPSAPRSLEIATKLLANKDPFNEIADENNELETKLLQMLRDPYKSNVDTVYKSVLRKHRDNGFRHYSRLFNDISSPNLPESYRQMLLWRWKNKTIVPQEEHLWQDPSVAMCAYAQIKASQLCMFETIVQTSDSQLFLLPVLLRACYTTYIGRYNTKIYREHIQVVCAPGTGKSDLIGKLTSLLIPGTYEIQGGASGMGLVGKHESQRIIELSHELDGHYAPTKEPSGDDEKLHKMLLGCLSEGFKKYKTTGEVIDPLTGIKDRTTITKVSEDTNTRIGNRNWDEFKAKQCGSAYAMRDRFTTMLMTLLFSAHRPSLLYSVLNVQYSASSEAMIGVSKQFCMMQDLFARYHAGMSVGAFPRGNIQLYNTLNSLMTAFIATRYPNFMNALRSASTMNTRIIAEVGMYAAWLTLFTPLNPTAKVRMIDKEALREMKIQARVEGLDTSKIRPWVLDMAPYNPDALLPVMSRLYYCRYEQLVFVFTEKLFEMTNVVSLEITRHIAERNCKYFVYGSPNESSDTGAWSPDTVNQNRNSMDRPCEMPLNTFVNELYNPAVPEKSKFYLGLPSSSRQSAARARDIATGGGASGINEVAYNSYELVEEKIEAEHLRLYETMAPDVDEPFVIKRSIIPNYKKEYVGGHKYFNCNYVCVQASIENYARGASGVFGHYKVDHDAFVNTMKQLAKESMVTPYIPLIEESNMAAVAGAQIDPNNGNGSGLSATGWSSAAVMHRIQSLRYLPEQFRKFPKFRVPVLIEHETKECFYLLISYFETDPYKICTEAINYISYHNTPRRKMILGVPSKNNHYIYESFTLEPRPDVTLHVPAKVPTQEVSKTMLSKYYYDPNIGHSAIGNRKGTKAQDFFDDCIEEKYANDYLLRSFPEDNQATLLSEWGPAGVDKRLHDFYVQYPQCLESVPYPQCMGKPELPAADGKPQAFNVKEKEIPLLKKRAPGAPPNPSSYEPQSQGMRNKASTKKVTGKEHRTNELSGLQQIGSVPSHLMSMQQLQKYQKPHQQQQYSEEQSTSHSLEFEEAVARPRVNLPAVGGI